MTKTPTLCCLNFVLYVGCINVLYACCILCLVWICSFFTFSFTVFFNKRKWVSLYVSIFLTFAWCINVLYKRLLCVLYFLCFIFKGEKSFDHWWKEYWRTMVRVRVRIWVRVIVHIVFFCVVFFVLYFSVLYI